jgi:DNA processing protein
VRTRGAALVTRAADVLDLVGELGGDRSDLRRGADRPTDGLDATTMRVLEALPLRRRAPVDSIGRVAGLDPGTVLRALGLLRSLGLAQGDEGRWRRASPPRPPGP